MNDRKSDVAFLRDPATIRARCKFVYERALRGEDPFFAIEESALDGIAARVADLTVSRFPDLNVPIHGRMRHFGERAAEAFQAVEAYGPLDRGAALIDLCVVSVLVDAGAGASWRYNDPVLKSAIGRSEGLALASLDWVASGALSSQQTPYQVDAKGLQSITVERFKAAFQVSETNPIVGAEGRVGLLKSLGSALDEPTRAAAFNPSRHPGSIAGLLARRGSFDAATSQVTVTGPQVLTAILEEFGGIWPGRITLDGANLGDVWALPGLGAPGPHGDLVPFHKLSQWLAYSLVEPLAEAGIVVTDLDGLTGLPEYRNGGLLVDGGLLTVKDPAQAAAGHTVDSPFVVTWRALTVHALDLVVAKVRERLQKTALELPLPSLLEGGTWLAGRQIAAEKREGGGPPLTVISDGTVF
jgi:hypothetical protein